MSMRYFDAKRKSFGYFEGKVIDTISGMEEGSEDVRFHFDNGESLQMMHFQDCCEHVRLEEIVGDTADLIGEEIVSAKEESNDDPNDYEGWGSATYTFYHFRTRKGDVTLRWLGESNGYYSERVDIVVVEEEGDR